MSLKSVWNLIEDINVFVKTRKYKFVHFNRSDNNLADKLYKRHTTITREHFTYLEWNFLFLLKKKEHWKIKYIYTRETYLYLSRGNLGHTLHSTVTQSR